MHMDLTSQDFHHCDLLPVQIDKAEKEGRFSAEEAEQARKAGAKAFVKVSPVRSETDVVLKDPYKRAMGDALKEVNSLVKLCKCNCPFIRV
jgi:hypothetical protein